MEVDILVKNQKKKNLTPEEAEALSFLETLVGMMAMMSLSSICPKSGGSWWEAW